MNFMDFTMKDLVGKSVLWTRAGEGKGVTKMITSIDTAINEGFTIVGGEDKIFSYSNGTQKATNGRMTSVLSKCELITDEQIAAIREEWRVIKQRRIDADQKKAEELEAAMLQSKAAIQARQKNVAEEIQRTSAQITEGLEKAQKLQVEMTELQDKLEDHNRVLTKNEMVRTIIAHKHKLHTLNEQQLENLIKDLNI